MFKEINSKTEFESELKGEVPRLVDFYAKWCGPCKLQSPVLYELGESVGDKVTVIKVDVDENAEIAGAYGINSIPTLVLFVGGEEKARRVGLSSKAQLSEMLIKYI